MPNEKNTIIHSLNIFVVLLPALFSVFWYLMIQDGGSSHNFKSIGDNKILSSFFSVVSHMNTEHLLSNVVLYTIYSLSLLLIYRVAYLIPLLILGILIEIAKFTEYTNIIGMSGFVAFVSGCLLLSCIYNVYVRGIDNAVTIGVIPLCLLTPALFPIVGDFLISTDVADSDSLGLVSHLFYDSISNSYSRRTSIVHVDGFVSGIYVTSVFITLHRQSNIEVFSNHKDKFPYLSNE